MKTAICTIIAKNYVSFCRTLFQSVRTHNPDVQCYGLVVDDWQGFLDPAQEPFEIISLQDLEIPGAKSMTFKYDITELSTAAKPFLLEYLFSKHGIDRVLYLDPDILVTNNLSALFAKLEGADFLVTPHLETDYPDDGKLPDDKFILRSGIYNLGFFGIRRSANALSFLQWWKHKLSTKCVIDHAIGYFVDQRFIDLAMGLFSGFEIVRDPGYNVAYWNIHSRIISRENGSWLSNGRPLFFYHFSGYNPRRPERISKYIDRYTFETRPDLRPLFQEFTEKVFSNGFEVAFKWPYTFEKYTTGTPIPYDDRRFYRDVTQAEAELPEPFTSETDMQNVARRLRPPPPLSFFASTKIYLGALRQILVPRK